jgi:ectoine hydroxylase-related dioxygenase (phytanoyl-CoA dioxygenase family)
MEQQPTYLAHQKTDGTQIAAWVEQFHRDGYLHLKNVLRPNAVAALKEDLDRALTDQPPSPGSSIELHHRMFERSETNLSLFDMEPIVSFAEALISSDCHVIHNNSFRSPPGGGLSTWHQDDAPHYLVTDGEPPTNVRLPVLFFTANYNLTDLDEVEHGPTQVLPASHLLGASAPSTLEGTGHEDKVVSCLGPAGSVTMFNNQVWHRGSPNLSQRVRYMTQVTYARRIVGHKYYPFMNYVMPERIFRDADERRKRLLGFLPHGAYG